MQRSGEEEEAEHPFEQRIGEVHLFQQSGDRIVERNCRDKSIGKQQNDGGHGTHYGQPDDVRQLDEVMIDPAEERGCHHEHGGDVEG